MLPKDSRHFAHLVYKAFEEGGSKIAFVIGDADGLSEDMRALRGRRGVSLLSLSTLTFTHKMVSYRIAITLFSRFYECAASLILSAFVILYLHEGMPLCVSYW